LPLKLGLISQQLENMAESIARVAPVSANYLARARDLLHSIDSEDLRARLQPTSDQQSRVPWLVATPLGILSEVTDAAAPPFDLCVIGCDSSSIPPDRHGTARYYALNTGFAVLSYGSHPRAVLDSESRLCFEDRDLYLFPDKRDVPIDGALLNALMEVETLRVLQARMEYHAPPSNGLASSKPGQPFERSPIPTVVLRDGPLTLWTLQDESDLVQDTLLSGLLESLECFRGLDIPVAGYISFTDGRDVTNSLRVWLCEGQLNHCDVCTSQQRGLCLELASMRDRDLFGFLLPGQRSTLFSSSSQILSRYGQQRVDFFYLNVGDEIVRIETPQWVQRSPELLQLLHAATVDQCRRSTGHPPYPPALQEAHEQAVITASDRRIVLEMAERALGRHGQTWTRSAKDDSKRRRGV